ncbi:MAG: ABC transporter permease [Armatimonadetes bacterium]|nr:ABC transporter permease [Armatimonadota bacterium]
MIATAFQEGSPRRGRWLRAVLAVFGKEMIETLRDRRTLVAAVVLPALLMPLVVLAMPALARRQQAVLADRPARIAVAGGDTGGLVALGFDERAFSLVSAPDPMAALLRGEIDALLLDEGARDGRTRVVAVLYDESRPASKSAVQKVAQVAARLALQELQTAARTRGLDPQQLVPVAVEPRNVATPQRMGGALLGVALPFFLAVWILLGGQYAALDVGVGERERGSLDTLLMAPPSRSAIVSGKFLAVLAPATMAMVVMLCSGIASARLGSRFLADGSVDVSLPLGAAGALLLVGLALGGLLSALQLVLSLAARTLREAQQVLTGLYLLVAIPVMLVPFLGDWALQPWIPLIPVVNAAWAFRGILLADLGPRALAGTAASLVVLTVPVLAWGVRILDLQRRPI